MLDERLKPVKQMNLYNTLAMPQCNQQIEWIVCSLMTRAEIQMGKAILGKWKLDLAATVRVSNDVACSM